MDYVDTIIIGGGQAGLATSHELTQARHDHIVLEKAAYAAPVWRNERWDSFTLVTPNWATKMPGAEYDGPDRDAFMPRDEVVASFERYVARFGLPVRYNAHVVSVEPLDKGGFRVVTPERTFVATNVVMATGSDQHPRIPALASALSPDVEQLHSSRYRNPDSLPAGAVLVVGSAQSGAQIAEELYQQGRDVFLSIGSAGRAPRRYRGTDIFEWLYLTGFLDITPDKLPMPRDRFAAPHVSGTRGGHTLNLHQFSRDGVTLLGHLRDASDNAISLAPDLHKTLANSDHFEVELRQMIDGYIAANGLDAPAQELPHMGDGYAQPIIEQLDLKAAGISTVIWATGYRYDFSLVKMPVFDDNGFPIQTRGVTRHPGLYWVGMFWMPSLKSGTLVGVGEFAAHIASHILAAGANGGRHRDGVMAAAGAPV